MTIGAGMNIESAQKPVIIDAEGGIGIVAVTYFRQNKADAETPGCFVAEDEEIVKKLDGKKDTKKAFNIAIGRKSSGVMQALFGLPGNAAMTAYRFKNMTNAQLRQILDGKDIAQKLNILEIK